MDETTEQPRSTRQDSPPTTADQASDMSTETSPRSRIDFPVAGASVGILAAFVVVALIIPDTVSSWVGIAFSICANIFGMYWQILLLATFLIALVLIFTPWAKARLGNQERPDFGRFSWIAMIMTTLLAAGGVFWAAAEPMYHYATAPPYFTNDGHSGFDAVAAALATSFIDWGFLAWAILGSLGAIVMMRAAEKGMPLRPRSLLYPVLGKRAANRSACRRRRRGVRHLGGRRHDRPCRILRNAGHLRAEFSVRHPRHLSGSAARDRRAHRSRRRQCLLRRQSRGPIPQQRQCLDGTSALDCAAVLVVGSAWFVAKSYFSGFGLYMTDFFSMTLYRGDTEWLSGWTVFFFGWFLGYAPLMAIFIARISKGRTVRDLFISTTILPPIATTMWFTVLGGTGIYLERQSAGSISGPLMDGGLPAAVIRAISDNLPLSTVIGIGFLILTMTFVGHDHGLDVVCDVAVVHDKRSALTEAAGDLGGAHRCHGCRAHQLGRWRCRRTAVGDRHHRCAGGLRHASVAVRCSDLREADGEGAEGGLRQLGLSSEAVLRGLVEPDPAFGQRGPGGDLASGLGAVGERRPLSERVRRLAPWCEPRPRWVRPSLSPHPPRRHPAAPGRRGYGSGHDRSAPLLSRVTWPRPGPRP